jgi:SAM-dependent methyltransferase
MLSCPLHYSMILNQPLFNQLINEAWQHEFSGWDFTYLSKRSLESRPSWNYRWLVREKLKHANSLLDLDTGGGEVLSSWQPLPPYTCATEAYPPNVPVARARLEPLGVQVFDTLSTARLPFAENSFDLVINRHGGFLASEIYRLLKPGRSFVTQQVGGQNCIRLNELLQDKVYFQYSYWTPDCAVQLLEEAGMRIVEQREDFPPVEFTDIGAIVYYLKAVSWQVNDFTVEKYYERLGEIHNLIQETGKLVVSEHRFYIEAQK